MALKDAVSLIGRDAGQPTRAVQAVHLLYEVGMTDEEVRINRDKVAGRAIGRVLGLRENLLYAKAEQRQRILSEFAKAVDTL